MKSLTILILSYVLFFNDKLARKGEIKVNGELVKAADIKIDPLNAKVSVKNKEINYQKYIYNFRYLL